MASGTIRRPIRRSSRRRGSAATRPQPTAPVRIDSASKAGAVIEIYFDMPVSLRGVPQYTTDLAGITPVSAVMTSTNVMELTFSAAIDTATELRIPYEEPAIRNSSGGFVANSVFEF